MIDIDQLAAAIAADLVRTPAFRTANFDYCLREAFRRDFPVGHALRPACETATISGPCPTNREDRPWT
jgi:hypothetical protein